MSGVGSAVTAALVLVLAILTAVIVASAASSPEPSASEPSAAVPMGPATAEQDLDEEDTDPRTSVQVLPQRCLGEGDILPSRPGPCVITAYGPARPTVVVWGDSHAWQQLPALESQARRTRTNLVAFLMGSCPPMDLRGLGYRGLCVDQGERALGYVSATMAGRSPVTLVLGGFWELYRSYQRRAAAGYTPTDPHEAFLVERAEMFHDGGGRLFDTLARRGVVTAAIAQAPWVGEDAATCAAGQEPYACDLPRAAAIPEEAVTARWVQERLAPIRGSSYIDTSAFICSTTTCRPDLLGQPVYLDELHLDPAVTDAFAPAYRYLFD